MGKSYLIALLTIVLAVVLIARPVGAQQNSYKVGAILEATGGLSFLGDPGKKTFEMIAEEVNQSGGINGHPLELVIYDTVGQPSRAVTSVQKLIKSDKVVAVLGPFSSGSALAAIPIIQKSKIPNIALGASRKIVEPTKKWVFNTVQTDRNAVIRIYEYMQKQGIKKIGIITVSNGFGDSGREQLLEEAPKFGIKVVADEKFGGKDSDMTAQLTSIQTTDAQAIVCWTVGPTLTIVTKNWKQLAVKIPLYQSHGAASRKFLEMAGDSAEQLVFPAPKLIVANQIADSDPQKKILIAYRDAYEKKYGQAVSKFGGNAHDAIRIIISALKSVGPNPEKIRDYIENLKDYVGIVGVYNYSPTDHNGLSKDYFVMVKVVNNNWKLLE